MNEHQVAIGETTFGGRLELLDTTAIMDYGSLIYITLQRAKTAREAIQAIDQLITAYGYYSEGESFSISDPNEVWIMEMIGKRSGKQGCRMGCPESTRRLYLRSCQPGQNNYLSAE